MVKNLFYLIIISIFVFGCSHSLDTNNEAFQNKTDWLKGSSSASYLIKRFYQLNKRFPISTDELIFYSQNNDSLKKFIDLVNNGLLKLNIDSVSNEILHFQTFSKDTTIRNNIQGFEISKLPDNNLDFKIDGELNPEFAKGLFTKDSTFRVKLFQIE